MLNYNTVAQCWHLTDIGVWLASEEGLTKRGIDSFPKGTRFLPADVYKYLTWRFAPQGQTWPKHTDDEIMQAIILRAIGG